jgi:hypothetical protein
VIESVLPVVAAPQATGVPPKRISPPTTASVAVLPASIWAVTAFCAALYEQVPPVGGGGGGGGGGAETIVHAYDAGVGSAFPAASVARTRSSWPPRPRPV